MRRVANTFQCVRADEQAKKKPLAHRVAGKKSVARSLARSSLDFPRLLAVLIAAAVAASAHEDERCRIRRRCRQRQSCRRQSRRLPRRRRRSHGP